MLGIREITEAITEATSLKILTQSYSEVAANKLNRIRTGIERNRNFLNEIASVYATVKLVAAQKQYTNVKSTSPLLTSASEFILKGGQLFRYRHVPQVQIKKSRKKTVNIMLTSNYRFYGDLEHKLISFFVKNSPRFASKSIVVGKTALEYLKVLGFTDFTPILFKHDLPDTNEITKLITMTKDFDRILVYHSKFQSVLSQTPFIKDIKEAQFEVSIPRRRIDYIFEPEIDKMLAFFDTEISKILLEQTFLESELARTAARLISMTNAQDNANEIIKEDNRKLSQAKKAIFNKRLLDTLAGNFDIEG